MLTKQGCGFKLMSDVNKELPSNTITIDGIDIAYEIYGNGNIPVLCVHGWLDNAASFEALAPYLADLKLIAIDLPGHGLSDHLPKASYYHFIDGVSHLLKFIDNMNLQAFYLLGHSLGGCLASIAASAIADKIKGLILLDAIGPIAEDEQKAHKNYQRYLTQSRRLNKSQSKYFSSIEEAIETRALKGYLSKELARAIVTRGVKQTDNGYIWRHDKRLLLPSPLRMTEVQVLSFLQAIQTKTLLLTAKNGFIYDEDKVRERIDTVPHIKQHIIDGGHHIHLEAPTEVARLIKNFIGTQ